MTIWFIILFILLLVIGILLSIERYKFEPKVYLIISIVYVMCLVVFCVIWGIHHINELGVKW